MFPLSSSNLQPFATCWTSVWDFYGSKNLTSSKHECSITPCVRIMIFKPVKSVFSSPDFDSTAQLNGPTIPRPDMPVVLVHARRAPCNARHTKPLPGMYKKIKCQIEGALYFWKAHNRFSTRVTERSHMGHFCCWARMSDLIYFYYMAQRYAMKGGSRGIGFVI